MKKTLLSLSLLLLLPVVSVAQTAEQTRPFSLWADALWHFAALDGNVEVSDDDVLGSTVDLDGTFGLKDTNGLWFKAGLLANQRHEVVLDYRTYSLENDKATVSSDINFGGISLPLSVPVDTSLDYRMFGAFYGYRVLDLPVGYLSVRPGFEVISYEVGARIKGFGYEYDAEKMEGDLTLPFVWLFGEGYLAPMLSAVGEFSGGWLDQRAGYWAFAGLKLSPHPNLSAQAGYSYLWFQDESQDDWNFDLALSGFVIGGEVRW